MTRIRTITAAGVLAGATVLGGAGLAGATDHDTQDAPEPTEVDLVSEATDEPSTGEADAPVAPTLPDTAAEAAHDALAAAPAFNGAGEEAGDEEAAAEEETTEEAVIEEEDDVAEEAGEGEAETATPDNHGQRVAEVAQSDDPGPGPEHGPTVADEAKQNGKSGDAPGRQG